MKRHLVEERGTFLMFSVCGIPRIAIHPKDETKWKKKVTCKNCKRVLKGRKNG